MGKKMSIYKKVRDMENNDSKKDEKREEKFAMMIDELLVVFDDMMESFKSRVKLEEGKRKD